MWLVSLGIDFVADTDPIIDVPPTTLCAWTAIGGQRQPEMHFCEVALGCGGAGHVL
jgi:hypothetical protein